MQCQLCDKECEGFQSLAAHLRFKHRDWTKKRYYDEFIHERSPLCKCGREKKFRNLNEGYRDVCSLRCRPVHHSNAGRAQSEAQIRKRVAATNQNKKEEKRKRTMTERYGASNPGQLPDFHKKRVETSLKRYGTTSPQQSPKTHMCGKWKRVTVTGREFHVQGYEDLFLEHAHEFGIGVAAIVHGKSQCPTFKWRDDDGKEHIYFPDFYDPTTRTVIEVKSGWTYEMSRDVVEKKLQSAREAGYEVLCIVYTNRRDTNPRLIK